jgi:membrane protease YdiL (CAAX protease family)
MDDLQSGKDTETISSRPKSIEAVLHLVLGLIFFVGSVMVLGAIGIAISSYIIGGSMISIDDSATLISNLKSHPYVLKFFLVLSSSLPLIVGTLIAIFVMKANAKDFLLLNKPSNVKWFVLSIVFIFVSIPLMGMFLEWNKLIDFSRWPEFSSWLLIQENANNETYEAMIGEKSAISFLSSILVMALIPAIAEEIFFRGFLMNVFNGIFKNMHVAIFVTAVIFSLIHLQFMKFLPMMFLAIVFGYAAYWTGSIWTSIAAHFINNAMAVTQLYFFTDGDYNKALEQGAGLPMVANAALVILVVFIFQYIQKNSSTKTQNFYV